MHTASVSQADGQETEGSRPFVADFAQSKGIDYLPPGLRGKYMLNEPLLDHTPPTANIGHQPDFNEYRIRSERRQTTEALTRELPAGWPSCVKSGLAWSSDTFLSSDEYVYRLSNDEKCDVLSGLDHFKGIDISLSTLNLSLTVSQD